MAFVLRKAKMVDVRTIHRLLMECASKKLLLPRSYTEIYAHLRDFIVAEDDATAAVVGCCALSITWEGLAEVRSLVVAEAAQGRGIGRRLVEACVSDALTFGIYKVFTLTYQVDFFRKLGFQEVSKDVLPQKVWADCIKCPQFPECDETAMMIEL
ncbi:acetyltransferase [Thermodesulfomicrobium sp. WS]|uniref:N-acetyltransferase n=1 Tax=Thermodesulfomicrobium sp. WS TaxID=3004129 RepID=UPI002491276C|nr:N-acetyltransferase [Thermodesulfomicrobium sp. WS]BDV01363.1 acetyltransferase [Thermodesulfomicrobium sp. WS]